MKKLFIAILFISLSATVKAQSKAQTIGTLLHKKYESKDTVYVATRCYATDPPQYADIYKIRDPKTNKWREIEILEEVGLIKPDNSQLLEEFIQLKKKEGYYNGEAN